MLKSGKPSARLEHLADGVRAVLTEAIEAGGSTLRDFRDAEGGSGYFQHRFAVYDREGEPCPTPGCTGTIKRIVQSGRSTFSARCARSRETAIGSRQSAIDRLDGQRSRGPRRADRSGRSRRLDAARFPRCGRRLRLFPAPRSRETAIGQSAIDRVDGGIAVSIGLFAIGLPNAILWGLLAALLKFIPYLGPWISALAPIALSLAVFDGWTRPLLTVGWIVLLELVSGNL